MADDPPIFPPLEGIPCVGPCEDMCVDMQDVSCIECIYVNTTPYSIYISILTIPSINPLHHPCVSSGGVGCGVYGISSHAMQYTHHTSSIHLLISPHSILTFPPQMLVLPSSPSMSQLFHMYSLMVLHMCIQYPPSSAPCSRNITPLSTHPHALC